MTKSNKGVSLISLIITIAVMTIIATITINISLDRFEINNLNKMLNDLELLADKVSNYYLKYNAIPVLRNESDNTGIKYIYTTLNFDKDVLDNENYYIIDLKAMDGISLNYGEEGFENPNTSDDVYIINENSHQIYYVKGIELDGELYHSILVDNNNNQISINNDKIPPTKPQINIIFGEKNEEQKYITEVLIEIIPGRDNLSGISETTCNITKDGMLIDIETLKQDNGLYLINENGTYSITVVTKDDSQNKNASETKQTIIIEIPENIS